MTNFISSIATPNEHTPAVSPHPESQSLIPPPKNLKIGALHRPLPFLSPQNHTSTRTQALLKKVTPGTFTWPSSPTSQNPSIEQKKEAKPVPLKPSKLLSYNDTVSQEDESLRTKQNTAPQKHAVSSPLSLVGKSGNATTTGPSRKVPSTPSSSPNTSPREEATLTLVQASTTKNPMPQEIAVVGIGMKKQDGKKETVHRIQSAARKHAHDTYSPPLTPIHLDKKDAIPALPQMESLALQGHPLHSLRQGACSPTIPKFSPRPLDSPTTISFTPKAASPHPSNTPTGTRNCNVFAANGIPIFLKPIKRTQATTNTNTAHLQTPQNSPKKPEEDSGET